MQRHTLRAIAATGVGAVALAAAVLAAGTGDAVIIANTGVPTSSLSAQAVQDIYLGRQTLWEGGGSIALTVLKDSALHEGFLETFVRKTAQQFDIYWRKRVFSGSGTEPKGFATEQELIRYVAATPNAIGYVTGAAADTAVAAGGCKRIQIIGGANSATEGR